MRVGVLGWQLVVDGVEEVVEAEQGMEGQPMKQGGISRILKSQREHQVDRHSGSYRTERASRPVQRKGTSRV